MDGVALMNTPDPEDAIDQGEIMKMLGGISEKTLDRMIQEGEFPDGFYGGRRDKKKWFRQDVQSYLWLQMRLSQRQQKRQTKPGKSSEDDPGDEKAE